MKLSFNKAHTAYKKTSVIKDKKPVQRFVRKNSTKSLAEAIRDKKN